MDIKNIEKNVETTDDYILLGLPLQIKKYDKIIEIRQVNWFYEWEKIVYWFAIFFKYYYMICEKSKLPDKLSDLEEMRNNIRTIIGINRFAFKALKKICGYAYIYDKKKDKLKKRNKIWKNIKWMKKKFTIDDWCEIFIYMYLYNIKGVKKNLYEGWLLVGSPQSN